MPAISASLRTPAQHLAIDLALVLALAILLGGPLLYGAPVGNHDVAAIGAIAERMLHGEVLYVDRPEPNPPLAFLAAMPFVALARQAGWDALVTLQAGVVGVVALSCGLLAWACAQTRVPEDPTARRVLVGLLTALVFGYDPYQVGQRDPMMLVMSLPYLAGVVGAAVGRPLGGRAAVAAGIAAGLGLSLKPHYLLFPIAAEIWLLGQTRSLATLLRREVLVLLGVFGGFHLWVVFGTGYVANVVEWKAAYQRYGTLGGSMQRVLTRVQPVGLVWAVPLLLFRPPVDDPVLRRTSQVLFVTLAVAVGSVLIQGKGFTYHIWPVHFLSWLIVGISALRWWPAPWSRAGVLGVLLCVVVYLGVPLDPTRVFRGPPEGPGTVWDCRVRPGLGMGRKGICHIPALIRAVERHTAPGDRVAVVATTAYPFAWVPIAAGVIDSVTVSPMVLGDLYQGTPTNVDPVPYHTGAARSPLETRVLEALATDLERYRPKLVLVDHRPFLQGFGETRFDLIAFYRQDPRTARILDDDYREIAVPEANGAVRFFLRKKGTASVPPGLEGLPFPRLGPPRVAEPLVTDPPATPGP